MDIRTDERNAVLREYIREAVVISANVSTDHVYSTFRNEDTPCVVVCEENRIPVGLVMKERYYQHLGQRFGAQLYFGRSIVHLMEKKFLSVDADTPLDEIISMALQRAESQFHDAVLMTKNRRLLGYLTVRDILHLSQKLQQQTVEMQVHSVTVAQQMIQRISEAVHSVIPLTQEGIQGTSSMSQLTVEGRTYLKEIIRTLQEMSGMMKAQQSQMAELETRAGAVTGILQVIHDLSKQSYLLSLNANIEAARSGEKGLFVIAKEIGNLATKTRENSEEVDVLVQQMNETIGRTIEITSLSKTVSDESGNRVQKTSHVFDELFWSITQNIKGMEQISVAVSVANDESKRVTMSMEQLLGDIQKEVQSF